MLEKESSPYSRANRVRIWIIASLGPGKARLCLSASACPSARLPSNIFLQAWRQFAHDSFAHSAAPIFVECQHPTFQRMRS